MFRLTARQILRAGSSRMALSTRPATTLLHHARLEHTASYAPELGAENIKPAAPFRDWGAPVVTYEQLKPRTEQPTPNAYLIDVREPDEVLQGSIPSSVNLPLSVLATSLSLNPEAFKKKFGFEKPKRDQEIVFYCRAGKRSLSACDIAQRNGFTNLLNYSGSWLDWTEREAKKTSA